jgi:hypothetical protein
MRLACARYGSGCAAAALPDRQHSRSDQAPATLPLIAHFQAHDVD